MKIFTYRIEQPTDDIRPEMSPFIVHQRPINKKKLIDVFRLSQGEQIVFQKKI